MSITSLLLGRTLANREAEGQKIGLFAAIPAMGLDGLSSAAYGPEAMLAVLAVAGAGGASAGGAGVVEPITWVIIALLAVLCVSYWQTIAAYPSNGGSYTVARKNLGQNAGLLAAAALMLDYMLNVAVGISAGVAALTSAVPALAPYTLATCLAVLALLTLVNLRGTRETGLLLAVPTYLFVISLFGVLVAAIWQGAPPVQPPEPGPSAGTIGVWLVLRAFAAGCTAMTGVEAVSNGVGVFREPAIRNAHRTLLAISLLLGLLLLAIAHVAAARGLHAMDQSMPGYQSVLSQLVSGVVGRGVAYNVTIGAVLVVLCLSANTSFVGLPRLCRQVASDGYLPRAFALPGRRLVYTAGVLFLSVGAGALLFGFGGITDRLIPLFAVGAFLSFTLSQSGMAAHWLRERSGHVDTVRLAVNGLGAVATGAALAIILVAKFVEGAWLTLLIIPAAVAGLRAVRAYYRQVERQVLVGSHRALDLADHAAPVALVPIDRWDTRTQRVLTLAARLSPDVVALHLTDLDGPDAQAHETRLRAEWTRFVEQPATGAGLVVPTLHVVPSPYRSVLAPLLRELTALRQRCPGRPAVVVLSELVGARWWETLLHTRRTKRLQAQVLRLAGPDVSVLVVPWELASPDARTAAAVLREEEPTDSAA